MHANDNVKLVISHNQEELGVEEAIIVYNDIEEGFRYSIPDVSFKHPEFKLIIDDIKEEFPDLIEYDYSRNKNNFYKKYVGEKIRVYVRGNSIDLFGAFYAKTEEDNLKIWNIYNKHSIDKNEVQLFMHSYSMSGPALEETVRVMSSEELNYISEKYYPYIDIDIMFDQFFTGNENILLLVGDPGLGKSKMSTLALKYAFSNSAKLPYDKLADNPALDDQFISVAFVKSTEVLANDTFWRQLEKTTPDFCIIDDLDYMLTKRDAEVMSHDDAVKNAFLNQFLSFTDGVEKHKTKFIITTNQKYDDIDAALLRKGRLFDILELRHLDKSEALVIWKDNGLKEDVFNSLFTTHEILPAELGSEINKRLNKRIKTATQSYLKEDGISKVVKASRSKKLGL